MITLRLITSDPQNLLRDFVYEAIFVPEGMEAPDRSIITKPELRLYYEDFGSGPADLCILAEDDGIPCGAVWSRIMHDYGNIDDEIPSLAIALYKEYRSRGIGTRMMERIKQELRKRGYPTVSLSVQKENRAVGLYSKTGFQVLRETDEEYIMVCDLV